MVAKGLIIVLNGAPRSGKSSIAAELVRRNPRWAVDGVDTDMAKTPSEHQPGIGLRPGGERPDLEPIIKQRFHDLYTRVVALSDDGVSVVLDVGHHDSYSRPLRTLSTAARKLSDHPAWLIGIRCPIDVIMQRRDHGPVSTNIGSGDDGSTPEPVIRWQIEVHKPGIYDLEIDTSTLSPPQCAEAILSYIESHEPAAFNLVAGD